jgi:hypothetical protein
VLYVGSSLALGVKVLDAGHVADGLDHPVGPDPGARWHLVSSQRRSGVEDFFLNQ